MDNITTSESELDIVLKNIPCKNCIVYPVCRCKEDITCHIIKDYLANNFNEYADRVNMDYRNFNKIKREVSRIFPNCSHILRTDRTSAFEFGVYYHEKLNPETNVMETEYDKWYTV